MVEPTVGSQREAELARPIVFGADAPTYSGPSKARARIVIATAAGIPALLYFLFVFHYAVNVPWSNDDWNMIPLVDAALHGHFGVSELWSQYGDRRLFVGRLFFVGFGLLDRLNEKSVMLFSAGIFIISYVLLLRVFRSYLGRALTWPSVLVFGIVWFSLVDYANALWSFQISWFLVVLFFVAMTYFLLVPQTPVLAFAVVAAIAGSLSDVQGFAVWPIGFIALLWMRPQGQPARIKRIKAAIWAAAGAITMGLYFHGYSFSNSQCASSDCSVSYELHHPVTVAKDFLFLVGSVIPKYGSPAVPTTRSLATSYHELLGAAICILAAHIVIQSVRHRQSERNPLPMLLIVFAMLVDLFIIEGRSGEGMPQLGGSTYTMFNVLLLIGIVVYWWRHVPDLRGLRAMTDRRRWLSAFGTGALVVFLIAQFGLGTEHGIVGGRWFHQTLVTDARVLVQPDRVGTLWNCEVAIAVWPSEPSSLVVGYFDPLRTMAVRDRLSLFDSLSEVRLYRSEGPPLIFPCGR
jgi:hypothetical protein